MWADEGEKAVLTALELLKEQDKQAQEQAAATRRVGRRKR